MAHTTSLKEVRPKPLQSTAKQVSIDMMDPMDPLAWSMDPSPEELDLLNNVVELEHDDIAQIIESAEDATDNTDSICRKRAREEENLEEGNSPQQQQQQGEIHQVFSVQDEKEDPEAIPNSQLMIVTDDRPRVSRRRKKKPKGCPKRPLGAFGIFYHQERQRIVESMTEGSLSEDDIQRQVGKIWRNLPAEDVKKYEDLAEQDKARYHEEMAAYLQDRGDSKEPAKEDPRALEKEPGYFSHDYPPPPPGVTVIPATCSGSDAGSVAAAAGMKEATPATSPVPPPSSPRWGYGPPPPPALVHRPVPYPSPVPSGGRPVLQAPHYHHPPRPDYYHAVPPSPRSWTAPPSPYQPPRAYSPHFGRPARPAHAYIPPPPRPQGFSIPPGMELALPTPTGGERKYRVTYKCYRMKADEVQGFLDSMHSGRAQHPPHRPHPYGYPHW